MEAGVVITHPNRNTPETDAARFLVILLFAVSIALMLVILLFGWSVLEGQQSTAFAYVIVYGVIVWRVSQWARGPLALGAALAIILAILSAIAVPTWIDRDANGYAAPEGIWGGAGLPSTVLGLLTIILVIVQIVLIAACVRAFRQEWQVELEVPAGGSSGSSTGSLDEGDDDFLEDDFSLEDDNLPEPGPA